MPELPEVETVRRSLEARLAGRQIESVRLSRRDIVEGSTATPALLGGDTVARLVRRGKQLALIGASQRVVVVHLGMTGQLRLVPSVQIAGMTHVHAAWRLAGPNAAGKSLVFRDPRRFGGLWTLGSVEALERRWTALGPDALQIDPVVLQEGLLGSRRPIKAALLDQAVLAGIGNIYADEALFAAAIAPRRRAGSLRASEVSRLAAAIRTTLAQAIDAGGSTLRDFVSGDGVPGGYRSAHLVYGRAGLPCPRCTQPLSTARVAQRTTVWCRRCQGRRASI